MKKIALLASLVILSGTASFAEGDATKGEKVFRKCAACHDVTEGKNKTGPHLAGIVGRPGASVDGFTYSDAMIDANLTWDEATLREFLANPKKYMPKTRMSFPGIKKDSDMDNLIAYLSGL